MKTHAEAKTTTPSRTHAHAAPVPNALAHQAQLRSALLRAGVQPRLENGAVNDPLEREPTTLDPKAAADANAKAEEEKKAAAAALADADRGTFNYGIGLIEEWCNDKTRQDKGTTQDKNKEKEIVKLLKKFNNGGHIKYEKMKERGNWDGTDICVNADYRIKTYVTSCVLVHEGSHALWRKDNPTQKGTPKIIDIKNDAQTESSELNGAQPTLSEEQDAQIEIDPDEKDAQIVQAKFYVWLRTCKGAQEDLELEYRLPRLGVEYPKGAKR